MDCHRRGIEAGTTPCIAGGAGLAVPAELRQRRWGTSSGSGRCWQGLGIRSGNPSDGARGVGGDRARGTGGGASGVRGSA